VLTAEKEKAVEDYLKGGQEVATNAELNWITTLVFMIPCIQSYYQIAVNLSETPGIPEDTLWYKYWIEENLKYEESVKAQIAFFKAAKEDWEASYDALRIIFRDACNYEIALWAVGEDPGPVS